MTDFSPRTRHHIDQYSAAVRDSDYATAQQQLEQIAQHGTDDDVTTVAQAITNAMNIVDQRRTDNQ